MPDRDCARKFAAEHLARGDATGWFEKLYAQAGDDPATIPWADLKPNPNIVQWLDRQTARGDGRRAVVIGCGLGDDAEELARRGFAVTAFDVAPSAVRWCRKRFPQSTVRYEVGDLLDPPPQWRSAFDLVVESYTLQAMPDDLRPRAMEQTARLPGPGGELLIVCRARDQGEPVKPPPWPLTAAELKSFVTRHGLVEASFEDYVEQPPGDEPTRRFRAVYRRTP
jgi:SAM-dependent methyltransferase